MRSLTVIYDADCGLCLRCMRWASEQPTYFPVRFIAHDGEEASRCFPGLTDPVEAQELVAIADDGRIYKSDNGWLMVLYATHRYRPLGLKLARPSMRGYARRAYYWVTRHRYSISKRLGLMPEKNLRMYLQDQPDPPRYCRLPPSAGTLRQAVQAAKSAGASTGRTRGTTPS